MKSNLRYRLSSSAVIEPLVNGWYAWSQLISPVPACLQMLDHHIPTLRSYLEDPEAHARLARDPEFAGGPFCDLRPDQVGRVRELLERTEREQDDNIKFAQDLLRFQNFLHSEAKGQPLQPFYSMVPERLRGFVELVYDYYNHAMVRFIEPLLYESRYYDEGLQSFRLFKLNQDTERPFFLSTPRFVDTGEVEWRIPFNDPTVDEFLQLDLRPQPLAYIMELLGLKQSEQSSILPHLTEAPIALPEQWNEKKLRIRYFGHACVLLEWAGVAVLTDPYIPVIPAAGGIDRYSFHDLPEKIDFALITHDHQDHFSLETLMRLRGRIETVVVPKSTGLLCGDVSLKLMAKRLNFKRVVDMDTLETIPLPDGEIIAIPFMGEHGDLAQGKAAYVVRASKEQILFAADSDCLDRRIYENIRKAVGRVETLFVGTESVGAPLTWRNGPLFPKKPSREQGQTRRYHGCDSDRALSIAEALGARRIFNYAMGKEPWLEYLLGLGLSSNSPQSRESKRLVQRGGGRGFLTSVSPFGRCDIYLNQASGQIASANASDAVEPRPLTACLSYWKQQLDGITTKVSFSARVRKVLPGPQSDAGAYSLTLTPSTYCALIELSETYHHNLRAILLAALQAALHKYTGEDDIVIATAMDRIGAINYASDGAFKKEPLVLRTDLSGNPSFLAIVERTEAVLTQAIIHGEIPLESLLETLSGSNAASPEALLQVMVCYNCDLSEVESSSSEHLRKSGLIVASDLTFQIDDRGKQITVALKYNAERMDPVIAKLILGHLTIALESAAINPTLTLEQITLLSKGPDRQAALAEIIDPYKYTQDQFVF